MKNPLKNEVTAEVTIESKVLCCSLNASLIPLAIASLIFSLEMVASLNFFFIGDCPISLFRSPLTVEVFIMSPMQNVLKFTDRIIKCLAKSAERKTTRASRSKGHVISCYTIIVLLLERAVLLKLFTVAYPSLPLRPQSQLYY